MHKQAHHVCVDVSLITWSSTATHTQRNKDIYWQINCQQLININRMTYKGMDYEYFIVSPG